MRPPFDEANASEEKNRHESDGPEQGERGRQSGGGGPHGGGPHGGGPRGGGFRGGPRGPGFRGGGFRGGRGPAGDTPDASDAVGWFTGRLPEGWFTGTPSVIVDREEITVIVELAPLTEEFADAAARAAAEAGRITRFREETRGERIDIARQAEHRYGRQVAWGAKIGDTQEIFTHLSVPVMTRLKQGDRQVLDTLIDAGVARSRSEALAWAVRLVGENAQQWLGELRDAMEQVSKLRDEGPTLS